MQRCLRRAYALIVTPRRGDLVVCCATILMSLAILAEAACAEPVPSLQRRGVSDASSRRDAKRSKPPAEIHASATSPVARQEAVEAMQIDRIVPAYRDQVREVVNKATLFRRLPTSTVDCYPPLFTCLAENPEVLVEIWRELGVSNVELQRVGASEFRLADSAGTTGTLLLVDEQYDQEAQNRVTMYVEGRYEGKPFARPVTARCVLLLRSGSVVETNGRTFVAARLDTFIKFDRPSLELAAKMVHPWVGGTADRNFTDTLTFISNLSMTAEHRPETLKKLAGELKNVGAARREQFVVAAYDCAVHGRRLRQQRESNSINHRQAAVESDQPR